MWQDMAGQNIYKLQLSRGKNQEHHGAQSQLRPVGQWEEEARGEHLGRASLAGAAAAKEQRKE